jgi:hypothetical protein
MQFESRTATPAHPAPRGLPVWLPWVLAPAFLLLPIGGCGVAASLRRPHAAMLAGNAPAVVPVETVATVVPPHRTVAWRSPAN